MKLQKIIYSIMLLMTLSVTSFSQTAPPAPSPGIWAIIDTNYVVGTSNIGFTKSKITLQNTTISKITGTQFRVFYDKNAFSSATASLIGFNKISLCDFLLKKGYYLACKKGQNYIFLKKN